MMNYNFREIETKWRKYWADNQTFRAEETSEKPKYYVLDMFPYPSGAGLHVGHPLGYIASDVMARYKRLQGFNVLHPMGYDSFGLPAEQYAIQTGQHPEKTTHENILRYREQLDKIGFSFDWSREIRTSDPNYYRWTQWIFSELFDCYYDLSSNKAERISVLIQHFETDGNQKIQAETSCESVFSANEWVSFSKEKKEEILQQYRLTYLADSWVNWCPELGTVLANDEVINGLSERGGHPVIRMKMRQWSMRITAYASRLLEGLDEIDWTDSLKEQQRNWIGKSKGASVHFKTENNLDIEVFTTRPDTIFGVSFLVLAPEHPLVKKLVSDSQRNAVESYVKAAALKSESDRQAETKLFSGVNLGTFAIHPFTGEKIQLWIGDYVLASYGTGAVMAVPCGDQRDFQFAKHFNLPIFNIFENVDVSEKAYSEKVGKITNSDFLSGLSIEEAAHKAISEIEARGIGHGKINYRLRDAVFSRQRYWGEPFPIYYKEGIPTVIDAAYLPIVLPEVKDYLPTSEGKPPLGNASDWAWDEENHRIVSNTAINHKTVFPMELNTMPGWAGSSWYFLRYMDVDNQQEFVAKEKVAYWQNVDLYVGGSEHAAGHLIYSRFWTKFLYDLKYIPFDEPFKKLMNQGMILGRSSFVYRLPVSVINTFNPEITDGENTLSLENIPPIFISQSLAERLIQLDKIASKSERTIEETVQLTEGNIFKETIIEPWLNNLSQQLNESYQSSGRIRPVNWKVTPIHVNINLVHNDVLDTESFKAWRPEYANAVFILEDDGTYICGHEVEKMSKSKYNVQTPDELVEKYGADTLRLYEMFLGPVEQSKPWDTSGISGVHNFLKKYFRLFTSNEEGLSDDEPSKEMLKVLHKTIQKVQDDLGRYSFNTVVSSLMICVNELTELRCSHRAILRDLTLLLSPYAPHLAEEMWQVLGNNESISHAQFPKFNAEFLVEDEKEYPVSFNGKVRFKIKLATTLSKEDIEKAVLESERTIQTLAGKEPKKIIIVPGKIINLVL